MNRKYSPEMRERASRMLAESRPDHPTMMRAIRHAAGLLGMSPETLRLWGGTAGNWFTILSAAYSAVVSIIMIHSISKM
ncbi:hypothetical protein [Agreia sp. VKM Ac-1783]|uniref:hypothetical protein n=1 Tax=Agreia sp. VKM Ac-1783 TaxID=1938889 RepID=UPI000A2AB876|nr:hypothetical protein [Agreia sp. VKM Ac-1783]SMQ61614.1 hypothetical protein SAMN06295943_0645 [Agreia sp. VKM Ac-1783]